MSRTLLVLALAILLTGVVGVAKADHHEDPLYVWINLVQAKPGQSDALVGQMIQEDGELYDSLVDSGEALEWGIALPIVHPDPATHAQWISFAGWKSMDKFMQAFMARRQAMSEEELQASADRFAALVVPGSHRDMIHESVILGNQSAARPGYIHLAYFKAKPGMDEEALKLLEAFNPLFDGLVADGTIQNHGVHIPTVHRGEDYTHMGWWMSEGLAARDAVHRAMATSAPSDAMARWPDVFEDVHTDQILLVVHHKTAGGGE